MGGRNSSIIDSPYLLKTSFLPYTFKGLLKSLALQLKFEPSKVGLIFLKVTYPTQV